jgi:hypothetical protein
MLNPIAMVKSVGLHLLLGVVALYGGALGMVANPHAPIAPPALKVAGYGGNSAPYLAATSGALTINTTNAWGSSHGGKMIFGGATGHHVALLKKAPKWGVDFRTARRISILRFDADGVIFLRDREVARDKRVLRALASWLRECNVRGNDGAHGQLFTGHRLADVRQLARRHHGVPDARRLTGAARRLRRHRLLRTRRRLPGVLALARRGGARGALAGGRQRCAFGGTGGTGSVVIVGGNGGVGGVSNGGTQGNGGSAGTITLNAR